MHRPIPSALCVAAFALVSASAAQTPGTALCDAITAQIRGNREITSGTSKDSLLFVLSKVDHPFIELQSQSDMKFPNGGDSGEAEFVKRFRAKFDPSDELAEALNDSLRAEGNAEVFSLPDSDLHVIESTGGSAVCEDFAFFQTAKDRQSQLLPGLPSKGTSDGDNVICSRYNDDGYLARVGGSDVFLEFRSGETDMNSQFRIVPLQASRWANACMVEADFRTEYSVAKVFVPKDGPVTEAGLRAVAAQIMEQHAAANDPKSFAFGPPISESERENVRTMSALAAKMEDKPVPAFGREKELAYDQEAVRGTDSYPLVLGGQTYLMSLGHAGVGYYISSDSSILILYTLKNGKLEPFGSAIVGQSRGALRSLRATVSR